MKKLNEITIADLMPDSISGDAQVSATARAIDPQLRLISEAVDRPLILAAIDDLSAGVLEHLAVQYDVTSWDSAWPIETKRTVLKTAIADKRKKGTRGAVERAIEAVAPIATLTEWWQDTSGDMPPHTFKIDLLQDGSAVDPETQASVIAQVEEAKPVRSHYAFRVGQLLGGDLYFAGVLRAISYARVRSAGISIEQTNIDAGVLAALRGMSIRRLLASSHMGEMPEPTVVEQYRYGIMGTDSESVDLIPFDESEFALMESTGIQQSYGEFVDDAGLNFVMSQNELMQSTGIQQSYGEFVDDAGLNFVMSQNELMETWEPPTLPTVAPYRKSVQYTGYQINAGDSQFLVDSGNKIAYDASVTYGFRQWVKFSSVQRTPGEIINDGGYIAAKNTGSSAVTGVYAVDYAICSSSQAEVITVYDAQNNPHNAFKFTLGGTDYYYVLDGVQTDWTDDLSSIGYIPTLEAYLATGNKTVQWQTWHWLYTDNQCTLFVQYDGTKSYKFIAAYKVDGSKLDLSAHMSQIILGRPDSSYSSLAIIDYYSGFSAHRIEYTAGPKLPTVSLTDDFGVGGYNWLQNINNTPTAVSSGNSIELIYSGGAVLYDQAKSYGILAWQVSGGTNSGRTEFAIANVSGFIHAKNVSQSSQTIYQARVAVCSSNAAVIVTVYDNQNASYNAFKYTLLGSDYYYVLDGTQTNWTNDLSSIGYSLTPVFPTVSITGDISVGNWVYPVGGEASLASNATVTVKDDFSSGSTIAFNTNVCYAVRNWYTDSSGTGTNGSISVANVSSNLGVKNDTNSTLNFYAARIGVCSSNQATVIIVYNSQNNPYNAFQYTIDGTDYYYVLDGVHAVWTDDLSSIGYFIPVLGYFKNSGASATTNESVSYRYWYALYKADSSSGSVKYLTGDSTKTYLPIAAVKADGTIIDVTSGYMQIGLYGGVSDVIQFKPATSIEAHHLLFKETT